MIGSHPSAHQTYSHQPPLRQIVEQLVGKPVGDARVLLKDRMRNQLQELPCWKQAVRRGSGVSSLVEAVDDVEVGDPDPLLQIRLRGGEGRRHPS